MSTSIITSLEKTHQVGSVFTNANSTRDYPAMQRLQPATQNRVVVPAQIKSKMFYRLLRQQLLMFMYIPRQTCLQRGPDDIVEQEGSVDEEREANDLQPLEGFPA